MAVNAHHHHHPPAAPGLRVAGAKDRPREMAIGRARQARRRLEAVAARPAPGPRDRFAHLRRSYD